jgi:hypothetical protein
MALDIGAKYRQDWDVQISSLPSKISQNTVIQVGTSGKFSSYKSANWPSKNSLIPELSGIKSDPTEIQ